MVKRILLALALAVSLGGAVAACNTPSSTTPASSTSTGGSSTTPSLGTGGSSGTTIESASPSAS